ncbi:MAG TPA: response regulator transcription factor [Candidatus Bipolaricaulis sp.]|nr:response regulator transcription factor [Candidatus Bipolaricaulis sp.]HPD07309.1 response regulator transcription factor [Candidatus Bipolaricaulis sp.]HRS14377.1 response regulator transcription factor [Candidatus Bipolaricaulis sp.]HRU21195.1 response regulator transcription factor [Candidatus Bipolaricaulis sp.]
MKRILVVDDDPWVRKLVRGYLEQAGFAVTVAASGGEALAEFTAHPPDLVVLDLMLPEMDGLEVARRIRSSSSVPIIMLTARSTEEDRVLGLELGADDYVVKPFSARELEARVRAVFRRAESGPAEPRVAEADGIRLDLERREAWVDGRPVELTALEFDLLAFLVQHPGRAFTRLELLEAVRGSSFASFERAIDSHIKRLRKKIEPVPDAPTRIVTVYGVGYKLAVKGSREPT